MSSNNSEFEQLKKKISNPASFGPGIWHNMHVMARDATTEDKKKKFKDFLEYIISNLPCSTCQQHASDYYKANPLNSFWNVKEDGNEVGMFKWAWNFHNTVNNRLKKPYVNWEVAKMLYSEEDGVCTSECGDTVPETINVTLRNEHLLQKYTPKTVIRPNSIEKTKSNRYRNI